MQYKYYINGNGSCWQSRNATKNKQRWNGFSCYNGYNTNEILGSWCPGVLVSWLLVAKKKTQGVISYILDGAIFECY